MNCLNRRRLMGLGAGGAVLVLGSVSAASALIATPRQSLGPFYPVTKPLGTDQDLTQVPGRPGRAEGEPLQLIGRVRDLDGKAIENAVVEIWQANVHGRYDHPRSPANRPLDPNFQGYGRDVTDAHGVYRFRTIKPAAYPASPGWVRPPHIHLRLTTPGGRELVTQLYFAGEPLNDKDLLLNGVRNPVARRSLIVAFEEPAPGAGLEPGVRSGRFDLNIESAV